MATTPRADEAATTIVVFGATGDLAHRKLYPALGSLAGSGQLPQGVSVLGVARTEMDDAEFARTVIESVAKATGEDEERGAAAFAKCEVHFRYLPGSAADPETFHALADALRGGPDGPHPIGNCLFYLSTAPSLFEAIADGLGAVGLAHEDDGFRRFVVEKPFGHDLESALDLTRHLCRWFEERQIFRIDHYLAKETVQNILALRFTNTIFEPLWNRRYVDHVQITVAEDLGVEHRGAFYEHAGALRDIVQNHVMQVLALTMMEPPTWMDAEHIRDEKVKLLRAIDIPSPDEAVDKSVRGQYTAGVIDAAPVVGYREEEAVAADSETETYVALRLNVDNWRWAGVPVYVRTGKRLPARVTEITMRFHGVPFLAFEGTLSRDLRPNMLVLRIQPHEGISLKFGAKVPGEAFRVQSVSMDFGYEQAIHATGMDGYTRLLFDAMSGDPTLFIRTDEVEQAWRIVDPYLQAWAEPGGGLHFYKAGTWGPHIAELLLERSGDAWREPDL